MEIEIKGNIRVEISSKSMTASVVKSPKATGNVFIPHFASYENKNFKIISIKENAFNGCHIDSLAFAKDSEVETIEERCFFSAHIKRLEIPSSVKNLEYEWCNGLFDLREIEVSPKNSHFIFYNKDFLLGKSSESSDKFDVLHIARSDIEEAVIPPQVTRIKAYSFFNHKNLKTVRFSTNSELKCIENFAFIFSSIESLSLPASLEQIGDCCFSNTPNLRKVEISPENKFFKMMNDKCVVRESSRGSGVVDVIVFAARDIERFSIPPHIKVINDCSFQDCERLKTVTFESNSSLVSIKLDAFSYISGPERLVLPPSLNKVYDRSFQNIKNTKVIEFLGKSIEIGQESFYLCQNLTSVTFPNADQITFDFHSLHKTPNSVKLFVRRNAKLSGPGLEGEEHRISYIESVAKKAATRKESEQETLRARLLKMEEENAKLKKENEELRKKVKKLETKSDTDTSHQRKVGFVKLELFDTELERPNRRHGLH